MDGNTTETCRACGFDASHWRVRDARTLFGSLGYWWRLATEDIGAEDLNRRPAPAVWSVLEYGLHSAFVTAVIRAGIEAILAEDGCVLPAPPAPDSAAEDNAVVLEPGQVLDAIDAEGEALATLAGQPSAPWSNAGQGPAGRVQAEAVLLHAAHDASHHFMDVSRGLAAIGAGTPPGRGTVVQINASGGGVPKRPVGPQPAAIGWRGIDGDVQADRKHHGRAFQALCLWSAEVIADLGAAGHPIAAGCAGENLTLAGIDWASLRAGSLLRVGTALVELSYPAVPCQKQTRWFTDGDFGRISYERNPRWARWYGWVRKPGRAGAADPVAVQP